MNQCLKCGRDTLYGPLCSEHMEVEQKRNKTMTSISEIYPKYYKDVSKLSEVDVYILHHLFNIQDPSGAIQHASKKLLLSGVRTGGKSKREDIKEARDTLTRWLQIDELMNPV